VFLDYDQIELDAAYDSRIYQPIGARFQAPTATARGQTPLVTAGGYGPTRSKKLDFSAPAAERAVLVFIHGGLCARGAKEYHFAAENITNRAPICPLDFNNALEPKATSA